MTHDFKSVYNPQFLLDVDAAKAYLDNLTETLSKGFTNTEIKDSVKIGIPIGEIYSNGKDVIVVNGTDTTRLTQNFNATLLQGTDGKEYVVTSKGDVMGVDEFKNTGGNKYKQDEYNQEKEGKAQPSVQFTKSESQTYGFDAYTEQKAALRNDYPELKAGYRPPFKSVASYKTDKVNVSGVGDNTAFRTEWGIPAISTGSELTVRGAGNGDETILYAYSKQDSTETVAGKLNVLSFDEQTKKVYLVSVNGAEIRDIDKIEEELNKIYAPAVTKWQVTKADNIQVTFPNGQFTHGGSSAISVYNADQKAVIKAFETNYKMEKDALYLFFVKDVTGKNADGGFAAGYMPLAYQSGFIYDNPNAETVAHELAHGAFNLYHTFSTENYIAAQNTTDNLMDYKGGTELWAHQWKLIHDPKNVWLKFLQEESEGEWTTDGHYYTLDLLGNLLGLPSNVANQVAMMSEYPDSHVHDSDGANMQEKDTWMIGEQQQRYHALTGGYHGVEVAVTAYALLNSHKNSSSDLLYLFHRFGDDFAHFNIENDDKGLTTPTNLMEYVNAYEKYVSDWIDKNIKTYPTGTDFSKIYLYTPTGSQPLSLFSGCVILDSDNMWYVSKCSKEDLMKQYTDFILAGIHGSRFAGITWEQAHEEILKVLPYAIQNDFKMYGEIQTCTFTKGHSSDKSQPDQIIRRKSLYIHYLDQLIQLLNERYSLNITSQKRAEVKAKFQTILDYFSSTDDIEKRIDGVLAYEIVKLLDKTSLSLTVYIPVKYVDWKNISAQGVAYYGMYQPIKGESFEEDAKKIKEITMDYIQNTDKDKIESIAAELVEEKKSKVQCWKITIKFKKR